jgi:predicted nucleotidyltransferase
MDRETLITTKYFVKVVKKHMDVNLLILFGSRARGDNFVSSDYDFIIVSRNFSGKPFTRRASQLYDLWRSKRDLEVLCYTPEEWRRLKDRRGILLNAQEEGIRLL